MLGKNDHAGKRGKELEKEKDSGDHATDLARGGKS
jgi:hypothetical protein